MVQRKAPDKLGIQADSKNYVKSEKRSMALKSSSQHPDIRNKGGGSELKKKMKKSRSFKLPDLESLGSYPVRRAKAQFDKPPTDVSVAAATPQKPSSIKISDTSPNYMKSTSSSNAKKERLQVSLRSSQTSDSKSPSRRDLKLSSASGHKPARTLSKTSSLKPVRTLTKTSSMKAMRPSMKKNSGVAFCPNQNVCRATCSSTLKDSKFPSYVTLHPGGTESEGTSVMKVCPYTYCSLNGHHHAPLPPLKRFLSARRRLLRTQKSMRLKSLSPVRMNPSGKRKKEIDTGPMVFDGDPAILEADSAGSAISPLIEEAGMDFFVEIYAQPRKYTNDSMESSSHDGSDDAKIDFAVNPEVLDYISYPVTDDAETETENEVGSIGESLPDESAHSEISSEDNLDQCSDFLIADMDILMAFPEHNQHAEIEDTEYQPCFIQAETDLEYCCIGSESERGSPAETGLDESISEAIDMDWEEEQVVAPHLDNGADNYTLADDESELITVCLPGFVDPGLQDQLILKTEDIVSNCCEEVPANGEVVYEENSESFNAEFGDGDSESDGGAQTLAIDTTSELSSEASHDDSESDVGNRTLEIDISSEIIGEESNISNILSLQDQLSYTEEAFEVPIAANEEKDGNPNLDDFVDSVVPSTSAENPLEEPTAASDEKYGVSEPHNDFLQGHTPLGNDEPTCRADVLNGTLMEEHAYDSLEDEPEMDQGLPPEDPDIHANVGCQLYERQDEGCRLKGQTDQGVATSDAGVDQVLPSTNVGDGTGVEEQVEDANGLLSIQISGSCQVFSENNHNTGKEDHDTSPQTHIEIAVSQCDAMIEDDTCLEVGEENLPPLTQGHSSDDQSHIYNMVENRELPGKDQDLSSSTYSEELSDSESKKFSSAEANNGRDEEMQVEDKAGTDAAETFLTANNVTGTEEEKTIINAGTDSDQQLSKTCTNLKKPIRCKKPIKDWEEPRKFNPREPRYLPVEPDPEAETVDLRHQIMDERKNGEEWMLDYALRQTVTKLAPARKKRVALLVEAFEKVMPLPKYERRLQHATTAFVHARPIQACS